MLLAGEAGIGKSRITAALLEALAAEPHLNMRYQCSPYHSDSALWPVIQHLGLAAGIAPTDPTDAEARQARSPARRGRGRRRRGGTASGDAARHRRRFPLRAQRPATPAAPPAHAAGTARPALGPGRPAAGAGRHRGRPLGRSHHARADRADARSGGDRTGAAARHRPAELHAMASAATRSSPAWRSTGSAATATAAIMTRVTRRQDAAGGAGGRDRRPHRWGAALCRGDDQGGARIGRAAARPTTPGCSTARSANWRSPPRCTIR